MLEKNKFQWFGLIKVFFFEFVCFDLRCTWWFIMTISMVLNGWTRCLVNNIWDGGVFHLSEWTTYPGVSHNVSWPSRIFIYFPCIGSWSEIWIPTLWIFFLHSTKDGHKGKMSRFHPISFLFQWLDPISSGGPCLITRLLEHIFKDLNGKMTQLISIDVSTRTT